MMMMIMIIDQGHYEDDNDYWSRSLWGWLRRLIPGALQRQSEASTEPRSPAGRNIILQIGDEDGDDEHGDVVKDADDDITDEDTGKDAGLEENWTKPVGDREQKVVICLQRKSFDISSSLILKEHVFKEQTPNLISF